MHLKNPKTSVALFFTVVLLFSVSAYGQIKVEDLSKAINVEKLQHPYLFFTSEERSTLLERIKVDAECRNIWESLLAEGHRYLYVPVKNPAPEQPKHPRYASEDPLSPYVGELRRGSLILAFLYQMTGEVRYAEKAIEFAIAIVNLNSWVDEAHQFDIIYPRVWPWNVPDDRVVFSYDIMAAGKALTLATVYDWVYPALTMWQRDKIRGGLLEHAITKVRGNYDLFWWSSAYRCNWSAICYSGLGLTALSLIKENPQIMDVAAESYNRINLTLDQIGENGGWQEGRGYYSYMLRESAMFMDALKRLSNGKYNMFRHKNLKDHPLDFFLYGLTANFGDSEGGATGPANIVNKLISETGNSTGAWYRNEFLGEGSDIFDIIWPRSNVKPVEPAQKSKLFKSINWAILRSSFTDPSSFTLACKAGYNDDPHHGHLDCGQFAITWYGKAFIRDIGRMRYDEFYFNEDRYEYPFASSRGHNVIFVNGEEQIIAKKKNTPWKEGIGGEILEFRTSDKRDYVLMDPTHAYPGKELKKWRRNIVLEKPDITVILDEVGSNQGATIQARFFPGVTETPVRSRRDPRYTSPEPGISYEVFEKYVMLSYGGHSMALIPLALNNEFEIVEDRLSYVPVTEDARLTWIPYVETVINAKSNTSIIVSVVLPVKDNKEAENIVQNAKVNQVGANEIEVCVNSDKGNFKWIFENTKEGYKLKI